MTELKNNVKSTAKMIDSTVFDSFKMLTSEVDAERFKSSLALLQHLAKNADGEKHTKERDYTLTRLIRGLGASTFASRAGYFTTLVGFLSVPANADIAHEQLLQVLDKQLHVGKGVDKEDSDALIGHILLCGALLRANRLLAASNEQLTECVKILVRAANHKVFHSSMAYKFLIDLLNQLSEEQFTAAMWPTMKIELNRPWERHTCNTTHFLLVAHNKYPNLVDGNFLQATIKTTEILTPLAYKHLGRLYWGSTSLSAITHPAYDALSHFLLSVKRKALLAFWSSEINESLAAPNKIKEVVTLKILTDFLSATGEPIDVRTLLKLITPRFIKMIMNSLKRLKQQKHDVLLTFYEEFFDALNKYFGTISDDTGRVEILQKFILHPGIILIEKYLPQKSIHQLITKLGSAGVAALFDLYKSVFLARRTKDSQEPTVQWLNVERHHAAQMMQYLLGQKCVQHDLDWRIEQLKFMLTVSLFHASSAGEAVRKEHDSAAITKDLLQNIKSMFYASLQMKLSNLNDEKRVLLALVEHANGVMAKKNANKYLHEPLVEKVLKSWTQMLETVRSTTSTKKLKLTFHILFLHMGLQLFREPDMAQVAIADLIKCMDKTKAVKKQKKVRKSIGGDAGDDGADDEPEWIEVVMDLFLHLLSQNTSFLRNVVNSVFPHLCPNLTLTSVHQVLAMLDMKDGKNPLSSVTDDHEDSDAEMQSEDDAEQQSSDEEDDDDEAIEEDEGTVSDQLRNAVSTALVTTMHVDNTDAASIDLNDMQDDEAERLDAALSAAFQLLKKTGTSVTGSSKKKSKKERTTNTTVMHFRIRVLDLIEIYLKTNPTLSITLEIMLALFNMIEYCTDADLKPLSDKVDRVLKRLLALRNFDDTADVTAGHLCDLLKSLVEKKVNPITLSAHNQLLSKSFSFLISNSHLVPEATPDRKKQPGRRPATILSLIQDYTKEFINQRNPTISYTLLQNICKMRWMGVWQVGQVLAETGLQSTTNTRSFRRTQAMELIALIYNNHGFISSEVDNFNKINKSIEATLEAYVNRLGDYGRISPKEFSALVGVLSALHKCHKMPKVQAHLQWQTVGEQVQSIRTKVILVSVHAYAAFCRCLGIKMVNKLNAVQTNGLHANGKNDDEVVSEDSDAESVELKPATKAQKRKTQQQNDLDDDDNVGAAGDSKKQKKLKKVERLRIASEGFNGNSFGAAADVAVNTDEDTDLAATMASSSEEEDTSD